MDYDFYSLKIVCKIVEVGSFSKAAKELGLTQPSVSQQVAKMEQQLGAKLFERVGHDIHLTNVGGELHQFALELIERGEQFDEKLHQTKTNPSGLVRYAMPESCQWTPHYRKIMSQIRDFPQIQFEIGILPSEKIIQELLEGRIDFGFVVGERLNPELRFEKFAEEHYSAVASSQEILKPLIQKDFKSLRIVSFPGWELFFTAWAKSQGIWNQVKNHLNAPTVKIGTLAGAIHATQEGAGIAILPTHCILEELKRKTLRAIPDVGTKSFDTIYIVKRLGENLPKRSQLILDLLKEAKANLG